MSYHHNVHHPPDSSFSVHTSVCLFFIPTPLHSGFQNQAAREAVTYHGRVSSLQSVQWTPPPPRVMPTCQSNLDSTSLRLPSQVILACTELTMNQTPCYLFLMPWNFRGNSRRWDFLLKMNYWHLSLIRIAQNVVPWMIYLYRVNLPFPHFQCL